MPAGIFRVALNLLDLASTSIDVLVSVVVTCAPVAVFLSVVCVVVVAVTLMTALVVAVATNTFLTVAVVVVSIVAVAGVVVENA